MRVMGLDIGDRRIGVALSDALGILASPLLILEHKDDASAIQSILKIAEQNKVEKIILGLPRSMNGAFGLQADKVQTFGKKLEDQSPILVDYRDERLTTVSAKRLLNEAGTRKSARGKKIEYDAAAAAIILQSYLNESKPILWPPEVDDDQNGITASDRKANKQGKSKRLS